MIFTPQVFNPSSIPSIQELLLSLAEYTAANITSTSILSQQSELKAIQQTLYNILDILNAYQLQNLAQQEYSLVINVTGILSNLAVSDQLLINARLASFNSLIQTIYTLPLALTANVNNITSGFPALQPYDLLSYFVQFNYEAIPLGLADSNFITNAQNMATAWLNALNYLALNGTTFQNIAYDSVDRMYNCSQDDVNLIINAVLNSNADITQVWNSLVALPSILRVLGLLYNDPSSFQSQSINVLKFVVFNLLYETNAVLALIAVPNNLQQPITAILRMNESLMDFANRTVGDYSQWDAIAQANNLQPPYVGIVEAPHIAVPGQQLFLPPFSINTSSLSSYTNSFLGTDFDFGLPFATFPNWTGDFITINGLNNYIGALYRRILTPTGSLIYHPIYGSKLPSRIGNISTAAEAMLDANYLKTSLLQDARTQQVNRIFAYSDNFGDIIMQAIVTPYGANNQSNSISLRVIPQKTAGSQ